jgi:Cu2+-exporting ATPase
MNGAKPAVAHSVRGRLRVRYPAAWLKTRRDAVERRLRAVPGVRGVAGNARTGSVRIDYDPFQLAEDGILATLRDLTGLLDPAAAAASAGIHETPADDGPGRASLPKPSSALVQLVGSSVVLGAACCAPVSPAVITAALLMSEAPTLARAGATLLSRRRLNGEVLEASTVALLALRGNHLAAALLPWLRSVGHYIVARNVVTTRRSLRDVIAAPDETVQVVHDAGRRPTPAVALTAGDVVVIPTGARIPVDGIITSGEALVNQQSMTGEALPVERRAGDRVFAATVVEHGEVHVRAEQVGLETAVGRIIEVIEAAADQKTRIQVVAERLADREVGRTVGLAAMGMALSRSIDAGSAILVADYGMAARVGIPTVVVSALRRATGEGILFKGPRALEDLARVDTIVFDKTGTLTSGTPQVTAVTTYTVDLDESAIIRLAAAAEYGFRHPVARAIDRLAAERRLEPERPTVTAATLGLGVDVRVAGRRVLVGSRRFLESKGIDLDRAATGEAAAHAVGASPTFVGVDGRLAGMLVLQDELRSDAADAVRELRARKMRNVIMLSGDHSEPTRVIADVLGLRHYEAELLPERKAELIRDLKGEGRVVAMVGDGVNDALALREADVGIAVPGGARVATEAADVVLLRGGLDRVVLALDLARDSFFAIRSTLGIAARANLAVVGLASLGLARPLTSIALSHGTAVVAAVLSSSGRSPAHPFAGRT